MPATAQLPAPAEDNCCHRWTAMVDLEIMGYDANIFANELAHDEQFSRWEERDDNDGE